MVLKLENMGYEYKNGWENRNLQEFWGEIAPTDHILQIYEDEKILLDTLEGFAGSGILAGDSVIIIATSEHLAELKNRLISQHFDVDSLILTRQYVPLNASDLLSAFMVQDWPHDKKFNTAVKALFSDVSQSGRPIRAFGEMVALLWCEGLKGATVHLEHLWNNFREKNQFCLFCAYPATAFEGEPEESVTGICCAHTKIIGGWKKPATEISFMNIEQQLTVKS
jgi:hypothetical protein